MAIDNGPESKENNTVHEESTQSLRNIDLNASIHENEDKNNTSMATTQASLPEPAAATDMQHEEIPGWSLPDVDKMAIDTLQLAANLGNRIEEEEDYDEEG
jgi:hypothetical protein